MTKPQRKHDDAEAKKIAELMARPPMSDAEADAIAQEVFESFEKAGYTNADETGILFGKNPEKDKQREENTMRQA